MDGDEVPRAHRAALRRVFREYLHRPYYRHRDFFRDALTAMAGDLGVELTEEMLERYRRRQWELHRRDFVLRAGVRETLEELRRRGVHLGIVSNIDQDQLEHMLGIAGIAALLDSVLSSERAGSCKPDRAIFDQALARAGCAAREALFVGDSIEQDIAGANGVGLRSVLLWHRPDRPPPDAGPRPQHVIGKIPDLLELV